MPIVAELEPNGIMTSGYLYVGVLTVEPLNNNRSNPDKDHGTGVLQSIIGLVIGVQKKKSGA